ncbi:hypothetical protein PCURB6_27700 [Paenibacillus curdlanolyticus]|nr:hypothetical protein PCURB6_27700 [Paenibacillus curdlanolyticus]
MTSERADNRMSVIVKMQVEEWAQKRMGEVVNIMSNLYKIP